MPEAVNLQLTYLDTGVFLQLEPSFAATSSYRARVKDHLSRKQIADVDMRIVDHLLSHPETSACIAPPQEEKFINEEVQISVSKDQMKAFICFSEPCGGRYMTKSEIMLLLQEAGVTFGVHVAQLNTMIGDTPKSYGENIEIATGTTPVNGDDAQIEYKFRLIRDKTPRVLRDGSVDHKTLDLIDNVMKDDVLAVLHPETEGISGFSVLGKETKPRRGKALTLPVGKNTVASKDGLQVLAAADGRVELENKKVIVMHVMEIDGNVDTSTGNIDFFGDVMIKGSVLSKYSVKATGNIDISGVVEAADIKAGGSVVVRQGIKGKGECKISAHGDITAKFVENAIVHAGGIVRADVILHSFVSSNHSVIADGRRGMIVGGTSNAAKEISASTVGSGGASSTTLSVGVTSDIRKRLEETRASIRLLETDAERRKTNYNYMREQDRRGVLPMSKKSMLQFFTYQIEGIEESIRAKKKDVISLMELLQAATAGHVHIRETIQPGVTIQIGSEHIKTKQVYQYTTFLHEESKITPVSFIGIADS